MAEWTLTEAQNGGRLEARVGDTIVITLSESGGGYRWSAESLDEAFVTVERQHYEPGPGGVGSTGSDAWKLLARHPGRTRLELKKSRRWETEATARFAVDVEIRDR